MRTLPPFNTAHSAVPISALTDAIHQSDRQSDHQPNHPHEQNTDAPNQALSYPTLTGAPLPKAQTQALADELNALYQRVMDSLNVDDAHYIKRVYATIVYSEIGARALLAAAGRMSSKRSAASIWLLGTALLSFSKILNNMELGHNVMHGQYDWMQDPNLNSQSFDWDIVCPAPLWQHSHNYLHHTFTNIVDRDHDVGYHLIRVTDEQAWTPSDRYNPLKTAILAVGFEWAVAFHDIQISIDEYADAPNMREVMRQKSRDLLAKIARQVGKDYVAMPLVAGLTLGRRSAMTTLSGNMSANIVRNLWTWAVIFCGHLTEHTHIYTHLDDQETKGDWYVRQILGSSNVQGSTLFHILTGNLSHQIEHHIFPDMPANRYASIAPEVQAICQKYNIPYNTGRFGKQFREVLTRIQHFSQPTDDELRAYEQSLATTDSHDISQTSIPAKKQQRRTTLGQGLGKYIPQVVRQAVCYAR